VRRPRLVVFEWATLNRFPGDVDGKVHLRVATDPELRGELFRSLDARFSEATAELLGYSKGAPLAAPVVKVLITISLARKSRARGFNDTAGWKYYQAKVIFCWQISGTADSV